MNQYCLYCSVSHGPPAVSNHRNCVRVGKYRRKSDHKLIQRYKCRTCKRSFSKATQDSCFRQLKRQFNQSIFEHLASGISQRRLAYLLRLNRKTIKRKFLFLGRQSRDLLLAHNLKFTRSQSVQFDDLETFEHSKCKPLSVTLAVEEKTRRILGYSVSRMPAKGRLAKLSIKKYGHRIDERGLGRKRLFTEIKSLVEERLIIRSDQSPHYGKDVRRYFPRAVHLTVKGGRGAIVGQGELKKLGFDPLFSLNHTFAKMRADVNRLIRRTWCTTKRADRLELHLGIMALYHNQQLISPKRV